jgi:hypothetical protein
MSSSSEDELFLLDNIDLKKLRRKRVGVMYKSSLAFSHFITNYNNNSNIIILLILETIP